MPALPQSYYQSMMDKFQLWKPILYKQIEIYDPSVLVFHGTYDFFDEDVFTILGGEPILIKDLKVDEYHYGEAYRCGNKLLIAVNHPICKNTGFDRGNYVNVLIDTIREFAH